MIKSTIITGKIRSNNRLKFLRLFFTIAILVICKIIIAQDAPAKVDSVFTLRGIVRDAKTKLPVVAAQIKTLNYEAAAVTDTNGAFEIHVVSKNDVLLINAYDYTIIEFPIRGRQNLEIEMYSDIYADLYSQINDVSGHTRLSFAANSVTEINNLENQTAVSVDEIINSRMNGNVRSIARSGLAGIGSSLFIRGK